MWETKSSALSCRISGVSFTFNSHEFGNAVVFQCSTDNMFCRSRALPFEGSLGPRGGIKLHLRRPGQECSRVSSVQVCGHPGQISGSRAYLMCLVSMLKICQRHILPYNSNSHNKSCEKSPQDVHLFSLELCYSSLSSKIICSRL